MLAFKTAALAGLTAAHYSTNLLKNQFYFEDEVDGEGFGTVSFTEEATENSFLGHGQSHIERRNLQ